MTQIRYLNADEAPDWLHPVPLRVLRWGTNPRGADHLMQWSGCRSWPTLLELESARRHRLRRHGAERDHVHGVRAGR